LLVAGNYQGSMLEMGEGRLSIALPCEEEMPEILTRMGGRPPESIRTARDSARSWKELFEKVCRD
jgi:hypothetical protein